MDGYKRRRMSIGERVPYNVMIRFSTAIIEYLTPYCTRIEVAGSLRRKRAEIGDIELIAIPKFFPSLFPDSNDHSCTAPTYLDQALKKGIFRLNKNGPKYKQFTAYEKKVDLFIQPNPATWGMNMVIRTGCWEFSRWIVSSEEIGGALPRGYFARNGRLFDDKQNKLETPEEEDVFKQIGIPFIPLDRRDDKKWFELVKD